MRVWGIIGGGDLMRLHDKRTRKFREDRERRFYSCGFCGWEFEAWVRNSPPSGRYGAAARHGGCSDQVKCPSCGNFLPTWE